MLQHRVQLWFTATEAFKEFHRLFRTTASQDVIKERLTGLTVENAFLLKAGIGVRRQYVGPQIAVVACRIAASKDMAERMWETAPCR